MALISPASGGSGVGAVLFSQTLGADTANIDTGANGIAGGFNTLEIHIQARTDDAAVFAFCDCSINNDTSANYDWFGTSANAAAVSVVSTFTDTRWQVRIKGSTGTAYFSTFVFVFPNYTAPTVPRSGQVTAGVIEASTGNCIAEYLTIGHRTITTAITRFKIAGQGAAKLKAGSFVVCYGR